MVCITEQCIGYGIENPRSRRIFSPRSRPNVTKLHAAAQQNKRLNKTVTRAGIGDKSVKSAPADLSNSVVPYIICIRRRHSSRYYKIIYKRLFVLQYI